MTDAVPKLIGVSSTLLVLVTVFVSIRFFVRGVLIRKIDWDDVLVLISYCLTTGLLCVVVAMTDVGFGTHTDTVSDHNLHEFLKLQTATMLAYVWGFVTIKSSFAVLYLRLLPDIVNRRINQGLLIVLLVEGLEECLVVIFKCMPVDKAWTPSKDGTCLDMRQFYYASFGVKFVTDIILFVQPIPIVWNLHLSTSKRIGVIAMLSIGLFVCIISIIRVTFISILKDDMTYVLVNPMLWSEVEVSMLIICAGIPSLRPFLKCFPRLYKAFGLVSDSNIPLDNGGRSLQHLGTISTVGSGGHKQSRVSPHEPLELRVADGVNFPSPGSDNGSTEVILPS